MAVFYRFMEVCIEIVDALVDLTHVSQTKALQKSYAFLGAEIKTI
jgi:hypothetical protein